MARIHSGDPALWAPRRSSSSRCRDRIETEIVPGVSSFSAVAALARRELTIPEVAQSVVLTRLGGGKTPMPTGEEVREFAAHGTTMAIFLSAARSGQMVAELLEGGYPTDTPVSSPTGRLAGGAHPEVHGSRRWRRRCKERKLWRHTLFLVGPPSPRAAPASTSTTRGTSTGSARRSRRRARRCAGARHSPSSAGRGDRRRASTGRWDRRRGPHWRSGASCSAAARLLDLVEPATTSSGWCSGAVAPALERIRGAPRPVVLASGDPGFFGIVRLLRERGHALAVLPARIVGAAALRPAGPSWDDVAVVSAHGRALGPAVNVVRARAAVAVLTGPGAGPAEIAAALAGWPRTLVVAEDLDGPGRAR